MRDLGAVSPGTVIDVVSGGGFGIYTLGPVAWGRGLLGAVSIFVGALVAVVRGGGGARAGVLSKLLCTFGSISGGGGLSGLCLRTRCEYFQYWGNFVGEGGFIGDSG